MMYFGDVISRRALLRSYTLCENKLYAIEKKEKKVLAAVILAMTIIGVITGRLVSDNYIIFVCGFIGLMCGCLLESLCRSKIFKEKVKSLRNSSFETQSQLISSLLGKEFTVTKSELVLKSFLETINTKTEYTKQSYCDPDLFRMRIIHFQPQDTCGSEILFILDCEIKHKDYEGIILKQRFYHKHLFDYYPEGDSVLDRRELNRAFGFY